MTSLRRALKASLTIEEKPPTVRPPHRGNNRLRATSDDSSRHHRRHGDDSAAIERQGPGSHSERNRAVGSSSRGQGGTYRRGRSAGDAGDASSEYGNNHKNGSDSDGSIANAGRGRLSVADRRQNDVKREKTEPVPVSPPRKSVIEAGHEAEEGSQIKVKFDTGHWFSGIISKVDNQRDTIVIDYDDGTKETSRIPDSDIVIYPWRPPGRRVRPRPLSQYQQELRAGGKVSGGGAHPSGSSRKHAVKTEPRATPSIRRKATQARDRGTGRKRESSRGGRSGAGHGDREGPKAVLSPSSFEEDDDESGGGDEADDEGQRWADGGTLPAKNNGVTSSHASRKNNRWQLKTSGKGATRGRTVPQRQAPQRKRPASGGGARKHGASKRQRVARNVTAPPVNDGGPSGSASESEFEASEDEEELDDASLGIKAKARTPRVSGRRKLPSKMPPQKGKGGARRGSDGPSKTPGTETTTANRSAKPPSGSSAMSESLSSESDSPASSSSSDGDPAITVGSEQSKKVEPEAGQAKARTKVAAVPAPSEAGGEHCKREEDEGVQGAKEASLGRGKVSQQQPNDDRPKEGAQRPDELAERTPTDNTRPVASRKPADSSIAVSAETDKPNLKQSNAPRGWQESRSRHVARDRRDGAQERPQAGVSTTANGREASETKGRGRTGRGQGSRGGLKAKQPLGRSGRLEASSRVAEGAQQRQQRQRADDACVHDSSSSVPQKCAEEKQARSVHPSSSLRKSPRSKETPAPSRRDESTRDVLRHGVPEVAEAKYIPSAPDPPSAPPAKEGSLRNDGVYGWEAPKQVVHPLVTVAPGKNAGKVTADVEVRVADQEDGPSPSAQREVSKASDGVEGSPTVQNRPSTPAELDKENESKGFHCQRAKCDDREGKPETRSQSDADSADLKASRSMGASSKKSKGKLKNAAKSGDAVPVPVAPSKPDPKVEDPQPTPADASPKHTSAADASVAIPKKPHPEDEVVPRVAVEEAPLFSARDAGVAVRAEETTNDDSLTAPEVAEERVAGTMDSPTLSLAVEGAAAVTSSPHHSDGDAMELDSGMEDEALLPVDAAVMRRPYSSDSGEDDPSMPAEMLGTIAPPKEEEAVQRCQRAMAAKVEADEEALPVDEGIRTLGTLKPRAAEGGTDQTELKRATKPARKRPRSEEKAGPGAKSDWPAPVVSRAAKPDLERVDVNEVGAPNSCPTAAVARVQSEVESAEGTRDSALSAPVHATEDMGMLKVLEVGDAKAPTPSNEEGTVDGVDSLAAGFVASDDPAIVAEDESWNDHAEVSTNEMANTASGEHKEGDPVSGEDRRRGGQRGGVGAPPAAGGNNDRGDPEPDITEKNEGLDEVIRGKVEVGPEGIFESQERYRSNAASESDGSSLAETSKTAEISSTKELTAKDSGDTGPPLSLEEETHPGVVGKSGDEVRREDYPPIAENAKGESRETPGDATAAEKAVVEAPAVIEVVARKGANGRPKEEPEEDSKYEVEDGENRSERENDKPSTVPNKHLRNDSGETQSGSDGGGAVSAEPRHVGRRRLGVTRFEPSMETDRNRSGQHRPERHERQAAVLATKRLAASAPIRRSSRGGRGQDSGARGRGGGRGRRGGRGGRGSRVVVRERQEESEDEDGDDDDDDDGDEEGVDWVQCDNCEKWWTLPSSVNADELPDVWHCRMQDWGKTVVDCLALKEPRGKGETGGAQTERKLAGKSAFRDYSVASTSSPASTTVTLTSSANSQGAQTSVAVPVAVAAAAEGSALEQVTAAAKAEAAVALVAAVATAAAAIEATRTDSRPDTIAAVPTVAGGGDEGASDLAKCSTRPVSLVKPAQGGEAHLSANVAALANVPDKLPPEPPPSAPPNDDLEKKGGKVVEKPSAAARGKRKREGAANFSSSDEECARGIKDAGTRESGKMEDSRACSGAGRLGSSRGRGRRNSNSSMGRHAVAVLIKAAEARRDSEPTSEDVEVRAGRGGVSFNIRPRGIGGGNGVLRSGPSNEAVNQEQWVMCDHERCGKWRRVPPGVNLNGVDKWYCEMATWSPATAKCEHPEDSTEMVVPLTTTTISGGGRGNGSAGGSAGYRGRRIGSRSSRTASEGSEGGAEEDRSWRRDGEGTSAERRWSDGGSAGRGGNGGRGRGRAKKDDLLWVQCDKCEKWRKLANGMRNEDLPEKWYCQMNTWSFANDCSFPDEYDAETNKANGDTITSWIVDTGGSGGDGGFGGGRVSGSGLLARGAGGINKKANGRLSYRDILFNNDGKLRPAYSAGPCASASAGYLFPRPGDIVASRVEESEASQYISPSRTGFHFSEKYCPVTGPERPPPRQHLLTASLKFTSVLTSPPLTRPSGEASGGPSFLPNGLVAQAPVMSPTWVASAWDAPVRYFGWESSDAGGRSTIRPGFSKSNGAVELPPAPNGPMAMETGSTALRASLDPRRTSSPHYLRVGTYERQREERYLVLHYLKEATAPRSGKRTRSALHSNGTTASRLLAAMRKRPWEGRPNAGTPQEWRAWVDHLEPMLERHLRWLTVDGLAARLDSDGVASEGGYKEEARFVAVDPNDGEADFGFQAEGQRVFGDFACGRGASAECDGVPGTSASSGVGLSMMTGGVRIMKSRPIKMVKPWR